MEPKPKVILILSSNPIYIILNKSFAPVSWFRSCVLFLTFFLLAGNKSSPAKKRGGTVAKSSGGKKDWPSIILGAFVDQVFGKADGEEILIEKKKLMTLSGYPGVEKAWGNILTKVKNKDKLIVYKGKFVGLTEKGQEIAAQAKPRFSSNEEVQEHLKETRLTKGGNVVKQVYDWLCDGQTRTYDEIAEHLSDLNQKTYDPAAKSFGNILTFMRGKTGLMENVGASSEKKVRLTDTCFPEGRP